MAYLPEKPKWDTVEIMQKHVDEHLDFKLFRFIPKKYRDTIVEFIVRRSLSQYVDLCYEQNVDTGAPSVNAACRKFDNRLK